MSAYMKMISPVDGEPSLMVNIDMCWIRIYLEDETFLRMVCQGSGGPTGFQGWIRELDEAPENEKTMLDRAYEILVNEVSALNDDDPTVRLSACQALVQIKGIDLACTPEAWAEALGPQGERSR